MAGVFPNSSDIHELCEKLFNKVDLVQPNSRWDSAHLEVPTYMGTISNVDKYDAGFFGKSFHVYVYVTNVKSKFNYKKIIIIL